MAEEIRQIILDCEAIQNSNESDYTKRSEILIAYDRIKEIVAELV